MGTDRVENTVPCMCGAGEVVIEISTPDHPWVRASQTTYTCQIHCEPCAREYMIDDGGIVRRVDYDLRARAQAEYETARREFMRSDWVVALLKSLASYLDQKPSIAAVYRCLDHHRLAQYSESHFRKKWRGGADGAVDLLQAIAGSPRLIGA